ncbi:MAG: ABC transporter substrate-binding protein [Desulfonatronovibrionaceae bacterium]
MTKISKRLFSGLFIAFLMLLFSGNAPAGAKSRVFILHSYEKGHVCGQPQHDGVMAVLRENGLRPGEDMVLETFYMDTKRKNNTPQLIREQAAIALDKVQDFAPDVLITLDDNAFKHVGLELAGTDTPVIFSGLNGQPDKYNQTRKFMDSWEHPGGNISGVYEKLHISDAARVHSRLFSGLDKLLIIVDQSPTGRALTRQIELEIENQGLVCAWEIKKVASWGEYKQTIRAAGSSSQVDAIYPAALLLKDDNDRTYTAPEIFAWTREHSKKPEIALNYEFTRMGLFGGAAVDFFAMGRQAGEMALKVLEGEKAGSLPLEKARKYALAFNLDRAEELGIHIPEEVILAADEVVRDND